MDKERYLTDGREPEQCLFFLSPEAFERVVVVVVVVEDGEGGWGGGLKQGKARVPVHWGSL